MHGSVLGFFAYGALQTREVAGRDVLEVGSLDVNGSVRRMVEARGPASYTGVDVVDGPGVDLVADAEELWKHWDRPSFDVVISTECMEHVEDWRRALASMVAVLRPGGVLVVTTRSPGFAYHHPPDRWRYTTDAFVQIREAFGLEPMVCMDDPEYPGVFWKARKPAAGWSDRQVGVFRDLDVPGVTAMTEPLTWLGLPCQPDGTGYYRFWQPWTQLARRSGHTALIPPPGQHDLIPDDDQVEQVDLLAVQRPNGSRTVRAWKRWKDLTASGRVVLVYEADDNILEPDPSGLPNWLDEELRATTLECLRLADLVTCSTPALAEVFAPHNPNVTVIPNFVHEDLLGIERPRRDRVTVNWAGGLSHLDDLMAIQDPLSRVLADHPQVDMHWLGWDCSSVVRRPSRFTPWQPNVWDYYRAVDGDIGVIPLVDTPFNRCRTPIKALEYAALGIPVLASDVEPYRGFVVDGVTGYLCRTATDWQTRLRELIADPDARAEMGAKAKEVAHHHTIQQGYRLWQNAYEEASK